MSTSRRPELRLGWGTAVGVDAMEGREELAARVRGSWFIKHLKLKRDGDCREGLYDGWIADAVYDTRSDRAGHFECKMKVTPELANSYRTAHGGMLALLVDTLGSAALGTSAAADVIYRGLEKHGFDDDALLREFERTIPPDLLGMCVAPRRGPAGAGAPEDAVGKRRLTERAPSPPAARRPGRRRLAFRTCAPSRSTRR